MNFDSKIIELFKNARHIVVFSGAGISQESGIPTFRDALTGLWSQYDAETLATPEAFSRDANLVWGWYEWRRSMALHCAPNPAHLAIATLARHVPKLTIVTQNVDNLHERAGSNDVIHLHGSLHAPRCRACNRPHAMPSGMPNISDGDTKITVPRCTHCGGKIRPGVVWFGEPLPMKNWRRSEEAALACDIFLSIGTSALVYPAAELPLLAKKNGACIIKINPDRTALDDVAHFNLYGKAGEIMPALVEAIWPASS